MTHSLTLRSCPEKGLKARLVRRALYYALPGALCLISAQGPWAAPLFILSLILVALGFIPYKRLCRQESSPTSVHCTVEEIEIYKGKKSRSIPITELIGFSHEGTALIIRLKEESISLNHFSKESAERLRQLYF